MLSSLLCCHLSNGPDDHGDDAAEGHVGDDVALGGGDHVADDAAESDGSASPLGLQGDDLDLDHARYWEVNAEWEHSVADVPDVATGVLTVPGDHNGTRFLDAETGNQLGSVTVLRAGTPHECFSICCRVHQCKRCVTFRRLPSELALQR